MAHSFPTRRSSELVFGDLWSIGEALDEVRAVTADAVRDLAADLAERERCVVRVGPDSVGQDA